MQRPAAVYIARSAGRAESMDGLGTDDERSPLTAPEPYSDDPAQGEGTTTGDNQPEEDQEPAGQPLPGPPSEGLTAQQDGLSELDPGAKQETSGVTLGEPSPGPQINTPGVVPQQPPTVHPQEQGPGSHGSLDRPPVFQSTPQGAQMPGGNAPPPGTQAVRPGQGPEGVPPDPSSQWRPGQAAPVMNQPQPVLPAANSQQQQQQQPYQQMQQQQQHYPPQQQHQAQLHQPQQHYQPQAQPATDPAYQQQQEPGQRHQHASQQQQYQQQQEQYREQQHYPQQQQQQHQQQHPGQQELHFPAETPQRTVKVTQPQYQPLVSNCPQCHSGVLSQQFSLLGILLAIFCFPCGVIFCLLMRERRCSNCGLTV
ncbi:mediator of RNA polymerase II transcription subunit 12-like [Patiria miniata]|uniref:Brain protein I3 n=1 Tax=Patiria miniata TaxID=46514 RepID=A0A914AQZ9_PATMI|nr:mediator of RNA polymerase II transcription subunit 12-like [Patiria miniata]